MRRFLYYFPKLSGMNPSMLAERGVLDRFMGMGSNVIEHVVAAVNEGPAGNGCIVAAGARPPAYTPDRQAWMQGDGYWVGIEDAPPRPEDLARPMGISGTESLLSDGCQWRVPAIHQWDAVLREHVANLPKVMVPTIVDGKSRVVVSVRQEYAAVDAIATRIFKQFVEGSTVPLEQLLADAVAVLAVNYRIGIPESGLLGILDEATAVRVLKLAIDLPALEADAEELMHRGIEYIEPAEDE